MSFPPDRRYYLFVGMAFGVEYDIVRIGVFGTPLVEGWPAREGLQDKSTIITT